MKLYLISRTDGIIDCDEYDSFVVAAINEESALEWCPRGYKDKDMVRGWGDWIRDDDHLEIECIGESNSPVEKVIIASFNAG